eukprot:TRINITY_DN15027_c0_g2_i3.p1 TRINITY_DN15027_c0_g2~~TRINITY_DN15027_c0_g2_i3.p1  ORF type:complete len:207 (-),score=46.99 TRINITY_DN15027_c0_g2_i3:168-788(-)
MEYDTSLKSFKEAPKLLARNTFYTCSSHDESKLSYCLPCRSLVCKNCFSGHASRGHETSDISSAARHYQLAITQLKENIVSEVDLRKKTLEAFRLTMENIIEKTLGELTISIDNFKKTIMEEALEDRDMIFNKIIEISSELEREFTFAGPEFSALEKLKEISDPVELLSTSSLRESLDVKKSKVSSIVQSTKQLEGRAEEFINDCE